jgi:hypothetical protein
MPSPIWTGSSSNAFATAANWSTAAVPVDADTVTFDGQGTQAIAGSDQSAIEPAILDVYQSFLYSIGSASTALQIGPAICRIGLPSADGSQPAGPSLINLNFTSDVVACTVFNARSQGTSGLPCVVLTGTNASNTLRVNGGSVGVGVFTPGIATTFATITVDGSTSNLIIGTNVTLTTLYQALAGGYVLLQSAATTVDNNGGTIETRGTGAITTANIGGNGILSGTGTITNLNITGRCSLSGSGSASRTVTNCELLGPNALLDLRGCGTAVAFTNNVKIGYGASSSQILTDDRVTVSVSAY